MEFPNLSEEKKLWKRGLSVAGLDEAGRGPLAGPVVAGAVLIIQHSHMRLPEVNDSKKLSEKKREELYEALTHHPNIIWASGVVSEKVIDKINILEATKLAMRKAVTGLTDGRRPSVNIDALLIDGNFNIGIDIPQHSIIKGDQKVFSIAAASIIAKVTRDRLMQNMHKKFPDYRFDLHKGYGTALHLDRLRELGACSIHRKSFYPVNTLLTYPQKSIAGDVVKG
jgi:ribonuclease HII